MESISKVRIESSPRSICGRQIVVGKRPRSEDSKNCLRKLLKREISRAGNFAFNRTNSQEKFRNFHLQEEFDTHDPKAHYLLKLPFLKKRSRIVEIVAARDIVSALTHLGMCAAFSIDTIKRICFLNISLDEVIRSLFYDKNNDSLITVSVYASDNFSSLKCRATPIKYIRGDSLVLDFLCLNQNR